MIRASWGGRDAFEWEFGDDGLYAFGRDISNIMIVGRRENGVVYPIEVLTGFYAKKPEVSAGMPPSPEPDKDLSGDDLVNALSGMFTVKKKNKK